MSELLAWAPEWSSVHLLLGQVGDDLTDGLSVVLLLPPGLDASLVRNWLDIQLERRDLRVCRLDLCREPSVPSDPAWIVQRALVTVRGDPSGHASTRLAGAGLAELLEQESCPEVIMLHGLGHIDQDRRRAWLELVWRWAEEVRRLVRRPRTRPGVCLIEPASTILPALPGDGLPPPAEVLVRLRWWWAMPSVLELRERVRALSDARRDVESAWRESLLAGVSAGDAPLADQLWDCCPRTLAELLEALRQIALARGIDPAPDTYEDEQRLCSLQARSAGAQPSPPARWWEAWASGRVIASPEHGVEPHPALLALRGERARVAHVLWRGQSELVLTAVDRVRLGAARALSGVYGTRWHYTLCKLPAEQADCARLDADPLAAELGYLETIFREAVPAANGGRRIAGDWQASVRTAAKARTEVAHYRALEFTAFSELWRQLLDGA